MAMMHIFNEIWKMSLKDRPMDFTEYNIAHIRNPVNFNSLCFKI